MWCGQQDLFSWLQAAPHQVRHKYQLASGRASCWALVAAKTWRTCLWVPLNPGDPPGCWLWPMPGVVPGTAAPRPYCGGGKKIISEECPVLLTFALQIFRIPQHTVTGLVRLQCDAIYLLSQLSPVIHLQLAALGTGKMCSPYRAPPG